MDPRIELVGQKIRDIPDFPKPGILFRDITPVLADPQALEAAVGVLADRYRPRNLRQIVAIESRGFIFGAPLALALGVGLHLVRKPGKLPGPTDEVAYELEYGESRLQIHKGELVADGATLVIDDLLATGGTAAAAVELARRQQARVVEIAFVIELAALDGAAKLDVPHWAMLSL